MFNVFAVQTDRIKKRGGGFFEGDPVFAPVAFRLTRVRTNINYVYIVRRP